MKILLIEDSRFLCAAIEKVLRKHGHAVTSAGDGMTGLRAARAEGPEVILLDMMLPGVEGTGVLSELKRDPLTANIPVVVLSSLSKKNEGTLKKAGAAAYLEKSALDIDKNADLLVRTVENVVDIHRLG